MPITLAYLSAKIQQLRASHPYAGAFCFFSDVENIISVLTCGRLLCRNEATRQGLIRRDCASAGVLSGTPPWVGDCARLYFAPKTPMLFRTEGLKRQQDEWPECPRPAYLVFDPIVATLPGARVSDGNMGSTHSVCPDDPQDAFFDALPFADIYYRGPVRRNREAVARLGFDPTFEERFRRRHAEILIPQSLDLQYLKTIVFRSEAERTLVVKAVGSIPANIQSLVDKTWFFGNELRRPYLDVVSNGSLYCQNLESGDSLLRFARSGGTVSAWKTVFTNQAWSAWEAIDSQTYPNIAPPEGTAWFYLNGHYVASETGS